MVSSHRGPDTRSGLVFDTHALHRQAGSLLDVHTVVPAPGDLGIAVIGVPSGSLVRLDLRLESVVEGVLVTGTAAVQLAGECVRCLEPLADQLEADLTELFVYPGHETGGEGDEEVGRIEHDHLDLEPVLRDQVVLELPFQPVCREDCRGLCPVCGASLNADPDHTHDDAADARWAVLEQWQTAAADAPSAAPNGAGTSSTGAAGGK